MILKISYDFEDWYVGILKIVCHNSIVKFSLT